MDREKELMLEYIANTLLIEKLHKFYLVLLEPKSQNPIEKEVRENMVVAQYQLLENRNAHIMVQLLSKRDNRLFLRRRTHNFSLEPTPYDFDILSPGCMDTRTLPFISNYRNVDFVEELEKLVEKNIIRQYGEKALKHKI